MTDTRTFTAGPDTRAFTVGPIQENAYIVTPDARAHRAVLVDPGEEHERLLEAARRLGVEIEAILITHCHFDHVGAVAPIARATGAPVYCPEIEAPILADITKWTMRGFGPYESWQAEHTLSGGERLSLAGLDIEVLSTPGHSPGHLTYAVAVSGPLRQARRQSGDPHGAGEESADRDTVASTASDGAGQRTGVALFSGDVLFQGSVGRADLPGSEWPTLERSIGTLMDRFPRETVVYPGHMGVTTLGREWDTNPFLAELRAGASRR
jgi:hydroxyacylglutathione hydrolase